MGACAGSNPNPQKMPIITKQEHMIALSKSVYHLDIRPRPNTSNKAHIDPTPQPAPIETKDLLAILVDRTKQQNSHRIEQSDQIGSPKQQPQKEGVVLGKSEALHLATQIQTEAKHNASKQDESQHSQQQRQPNKNKVQIEQGDKPRQIKLTSSQILIPPQANHSPIPPPLLIPPLCLQTGQIKSPLKYLEQAHQQQQQRQYMQHAQMWQQQHWNNYNYYGGASPPVKQPVVRAVEPPHIRQVSSIILAKQNHSHGHALNAAAGVSVEDEDSMGQVGGEQKIQSPKIMAKRYSIRN